MPTNNSFNFQYDHNKRSCHLSVKGTVAVIVIAAAVLLAFLLR